MAKLSTTPDPGTWDGLAPMPIRVLVKGASTTVVVEPSGGPRTHQAYPWWLEALLRTAGMEATVRNAGIEGHRITKAMCDWQIEVHQWAPDVVVLNYVAYESMPGLLPWRLERHATGWHRHSGPVRELYRSRIADPMWRQLARYQRAVAPRLSGVGPFRSSPKKTLSELKYLIDRIRTVGTPLVIVMETWPPGPRYKRWFPTTYERSAFYRQAMRDLVSSYSSPDVQLFPTWDLVERLDPTVVLPDGAHYSPFLHRQIAQGLCEIILEWARSQPHLAAAEPAGSPFLLPAAQVDSRRA